jgi:hypothetical protein
LRAWIKRAQWERQQEQDDEAAEEKLRRQERVASLFDTLKGPTPAKPKSEGPSGRSPSRTGQHLKKETPSGGAPGQKAEVSKRAALPPHPDLPRKGEGIRPAYRGEPASGPTHLGAGNVAVSGTLLPEGHHSEEKASEQIKPNPGKSDRIKPNQTNSDLKQDEAGIAIKVEGSGFRVDKKDEPDLDDSAEKTVCPTSSG